MAVSTTSESSEAVAQLLERTFGQPAVIHTDVQRGRTVVRIYRAERPGQASAWREQWAAGLRAVREAGLNPGRCGITVKRLRAEDWAESWKRHFRPLEIGSTLLLKPSWSRRRPRKNQVVVVLDPGLSFGTGHHATTAFCLAQLTAFRRPRQRQSFLDIGTGSGILAIAAAKLGYKPVHAIDSDVEAIRVARANAAQNGVAGRICFRWQDLTRLPRVGRNRFDLICANLVYDVLLEGRARLVHRLGASGRLVLAGILGTQFASIRNAYKTAGLRLVGSRKRSGWHSGAFAAAHSPRV